MEAVLVDLPLHPREGHAVVRRDDHERVVELAGLLEMVEDPAEVRVEPLDLEGVVEHVAADHVRVGEVGRQRHVGERPARASAGAFLVDAVGLVAADPEAERLAGLAFREEGGEVPRVVGVADPLAAAACSCTAGTPARRGCA